MKRRTIMHPISACQTATCAERQQQPFLSIFAIGAQNGYSCVLTVNTPLSFLSASKGEEKWPRQKEPSSIHAPGCLPVCLSACPPACALQPYTCSLQRAVLKQWRQVHRIYRPPAPGYSMWCDGALAGRWVGTPRFIGTGKEDSFPLHRSTFAPH